MSPLMLSEYNAWVMIFCLMACLTGYDSSSLTVFGSHNGHNLVVYLAH